MTDIVERLNGSLLGLGPLDWLLRANITEAAAHITALTRERDEFRLDAVMLKQYKIQTEVERDDLREALKPFADSAKDWSPEWSDMRTEVIRVRIGDLRRAARALTTDTKKPGSPFGEPGL